MTDYIASLEFTPSQFANQSMAARECLLSAQSLLDGNSFKILPGYHSAVPDQKLQGPYHLQIMSHEGRMVLRPFNAAGEQLPDILVAIAPYRDVIKLYIGQMEQCIDAHHKGDKQTFETLDIGRRGFHNEGAERVQEHLERRKVAVDAMTARHFFSIVCFLSMDRQKKNLFLLKSEI